MFKMFGASLALVCAVMASDAALAVQSSGAFTVTAGTVQPIGGNGNDFTTNLAGLGLTNKSLAGSSVVSNGGRYSISLLGYENGNTNYFSVDGGVTKLGNVTWSGFGNVFSNPTLLGESTSPLAKWLFKSQNVGDGASGIGHAGFAIFSPDGIKTGDVFKTNTLYIGFNDNGGDSDHDDGILRVSEVPEPATWALLLVGFGMVGFASRHRTHVSA